MSRHHWMYFGCQCSSARCRRLLLARLTLLGIFSAEIMGTSPSRAQRSTAAARATPRVRTRRSRALPIEFRTPLLSVHLQRAFVADRVRALEDPVLPRRQPAEDLRLHRLRSREAEVGLETGHRVRRERGAGFDGEPDLV